MNKLLCLLGGALLLSNVHAQRIRSLHVGDTVPDITFNNIINYKTSTAKLSDFKGKLIILDFFGTWCGSCIPVVPRLDSLQKVMKDKIQVIVVCEDPSNATVSNFVKKKWTDKGIDISLPFVLTDSVLGGLFPHRMVPHEVWISPSGMLRAVTDEAEVTRSNLTAVIDHQSVNLKQKTDQMNFDRNLPLFVNGNGGSAQPLIWKSIFGGFIDGVPACGGSTIDSGSGMKRVYFINMPPLLLIQNATGVNNSRILFYEKGSQLHFNDLWNNWVRKQMCCYELTMQDTVPASRYKEVMLDDICRYLNLRIEREKREEDCYVLEKLHSQYKTGTLYSNRPGSISIHDQKINVLIAALEAQAFSPVVDETGCKNKISIDIPPDGIQNRKALAAALAAGGFSLTRAKREIDMLVIYDLNPTPGQLANSTLKTMKK